MQKQFQRQTLILRDVVYATIRKKNNQQLKSGHQSYINLRSVSPDVCCLITVVPMVEMSLPKSRAASACQLAEGSGEGMWVLRQIPLCWRPGYGSGIAHLPFGSLLLTGTVSPEENNCVNLLPSSFLYVKTKIALDSQACTTLGDKVPGMNYLSVNFALPDHTFLGQRFFFDKGWAALESVWGVGVTLRLLMKHFAFIHVFLYKRTFAGIVLVITLQLPVMKQ